MKYKQNLYGHTNISIHSYIVVPFTLCIYVKHTHTSIDLYGNNNNTYKMYT